MLISAGTFIAAFINENSYIKKRKWLDRFSDFRFFTVVRNLAVCSSRNSNLQK